MSTGNKLKKKIIITGGHLTPALATIEEIKLNNDWQIFFFGRKHAAEGDSTPSPESQIIPTLGIKFITIAAGRVQRRLTRWTALAALRIPVGFLQSLYYLAIIRPNVILSFGGYLSVPVVFAGWILGIPVVTHEQTVVAGLATTINAFFAKKIAVSWPQALSLFPKKKVILTGNPVRKSFFEKPSKQLVSAFQHSADLPLIFVGGSNQGSRLINQTIADILPELLRFSNVFHQCGHLKSFSDFEYLSTIRRNLPPELQERYTLERYVLADEMSAWMRKADLLVGRAGANIVTEICLLGKPALFIPIPWLYKNEQTKNARMLQKIGLAEILPQSELSGSNLLALIKKMLSNKNTYLHAVKKASLLVRYDAAEKLANLVFSTAR